MATPPPPKYNPPYRLSSYSSLPSKEFGDINLETSYNGQGSSNNGPYNSYSDSGMFNSPAAAASSTTFKSYTTSSRVMPSRIDPQRFRRSRVTLVIEILTEASIALLMLPFLILVVFVTKIDGQKESAWGDKVKSATNFGPTFFPIFFAGVIGHALWNIANWKLEQGTTIGSLESLMGSRTIMSTVTTLFMLRRISLISVFLILLWGISPIGGQASLRLLQMRETFVGNPITLNYVNTFDSEPGMFSSFVGASTVSSSLSVTNTLFNAAFVANATSDQDPWGNPRLIRAPIREVQPGASTNISDWISLVGIPIADIPERGNTSFTIKAGYIKVDIHDMTSGPINLNQSCPSGYPSHFGFNVTKGSSTSTTMQMIIGALPTNKGTTIDLTVDTQRAEFDVACESATLCKTIAHRIIDEGKQTSQLFGTTGLNLLMQLPCSDGEVRVELWTKAEAYLITGMPLIPVMTQTAENATLYRENNISLLKNLDRETLTRRIETLLNTYYLAGYWESYGLAYKFPTAHSTMNNGNWTMKSTTTGKTGHLEMRYKVAKPWVAVLILSSILPMAVSVYASTLKFKTCRIEVLGYVSALTRDNPYIESAEGPVVNSTLGGLNRTKAMQDREICFGDIGDPNDPHGHLAVCDVKLRTAKISKKKSYIGLGQ